MAFRYPQTQNLFAVAGLSIGGCGSCLAIYLVIFDPKIWLEDEMLVAGPFQSLLCSLNQGHEISLF